MIAIELSVWDFSLEAQTRITSVSYLEDDLLSLLEAFDHPK
jgi:hypothetical protein